MDNFKIMANKEVQKHPFNVTEPNLLPHKYIQRTTMSGDILQPNLNLKPSKVQSKAPLPIV